MKKILLSLAILLGSALSVSAQKTLIAKSIKSFYTIPSYFTYNHTPYLTDSKSGEINIYDLNLNKVACISHEFRAEEEMEIRQVIDKNGISTSISQNDVYLTQTFFNEDEDWEYITSEYDENYHRTYIIKKTDGSIVGSIPSNWRRQIYIFNDVIYTAFEGEYDEKTNTTTYYFYTIPEFHKLISADADPDAVKATPAMTQTVSEETYDLSGRKVSERQRGIVIKDGKKVMNQ